MSFSVEYLPSKEEIFQKSDQECWEQAEIFRTIGGVFFDPDFPPNALSLGNMMFEDDTKDSVNNVWLQPHHLSTSDLRLAQRDRWHIWEDPWPFHVCQGKAGNCWLLAALMAISRRKDLLEQIIPRREYTLVCGIVQVRLFVNGKWKVIKTDFHLPQINGIEYCAKLPQKQTWVAFIEKAYAKALGSYGGLHGGHSNDAFKCLTGSSSRKIDIKKSTEPEALWNELFSYHTSGFFLAASTRHVADTDKEELESYKNNNLVKNHAYSILNFQILDGHYLIQLATSQTFSLHDEALSQQKLFWMEMKDFVRFFANIYICEYRSDWKESQFNQKIKRNLKTDYATQLVRLEVEKWCELEIEVTQRNEKETKKLFLNIHQSDSKNHCGKLQFSTKISESCMKTYLNPGTYLIVVTSFEDLEEQNFDWTIRHSEPISISFISSPLSVERVSLMQGIVNDAECKDDDDVKIYTWRDKDTVLMIVDNYRKDQYVRVSASIKSTNIKDLKKYNAFDGPVLVPPMSRCLAGQINCTKDEKTEWKCEVDSECAVEWSWLSTWTSIVQGGVKNIDARDVTPLTEFM
ncbi:unnamed protein product [Caenorhabditis brenneri]